MPTDPRQHALFTAAQMRRIDADLVARHGMTGLELMQRAADAAFAFLRARWPLARHLLLLCGPGNNGGDGYLLAQRALQAGRHVEVIALGSSTGGDAHRAMLTWQGAITSMCPGLSLPDADLLVDALFGTGLSRDLEGDAAELIAAANAARCPRFALDVPSGIDSDSGAVRGCAIRADATLGFVGHKRGLRTGAALDWVGDLHLDTLELATGWVGVVDADAQLLEWKNLLQRLPVRLNNAHKGLCGRLLAIGGDNGMAGAIALTGEAALRCGAGLVQVATRAEHAGAMIAARPELLVRGINGPQDLADAFGPASAIAVGPGLGTAAWGHALWHAALGADRPLLLDADALNLLARQPRDVPTQCVMTPHPAEAARLLACDTRDVQQDRYAASRQLAQRYKAVVVLKGGGTLIATAGGQVAVCPWGNSGMATAGMGDVLSGVIAALLAQGLDAWNAACLGVAVHSRAGDLAALPRGPRGILASDLFLPLQALLNGRHNDV